MWTVKSCWQAQSNRQENRVDVFHALNFSMNGCPIPLRKCSTNRVLHDFPLLLTKLTTSNFLQIHFFFFILKVFNRQEGYISTKSVLCISLNFAMIITGFHLFILGFIMPDNFDSYLLKIEHEIFPF